MCEGACARSLAAAYFMSMPGLMSKLSLTSCSSSGSASGDVPKCDTWKHHEREWSSRHEMSFNIKQCGDIIVGRFSVILTMTPYRVP